MARCRSQSGTWVALSSYLRTSVLPRSDKSSRRSHGAAPWSAHALGSAERAAAREIGDVIVTEVWGQTTWQATKPTRVSPRKPSEFGNFLPPTRRRSVAHPLKRAYLAPHRPQCCPGSADRRIPLARPMRLLGRRGSADTPPPLDQRGGSASGPAAEPAPQGYFLLPQSSQACVARADGDSSTVVKCLPAPEISSEGPGEGLAWVPWCAFYARRLPFPAFCNTALPPCTMRSAAWASLQRAGHC